MSMCKLRIFVLLFQEEANGDDNDDEEDDDDDDDVGSSSEDDQEEAVGVVDEAFRAEVQAALGSAMVDMEKEVCLGRTIISDNRQYTKLY